MFSNHSAHSDLNRLGVFTPVPSKALLDSAKAASDAAAALKRDAFLDAAGEFASNDIRSSAISALKEWAAGGTAALDTDETLADRLIAFAVGIADENKDGEISADEGDVINLALNAMADYIVSKGGSEEDAVALLQDNDAGAAERIAELLSGSAEDDDVDSFVFDGESSDSVMDSVLDSIESGDPVFDAVYKKKMVIRKGKKMRINKRVSGHVRLTAGQKVAIRKAGLKSRSSTARMHRMKSMKIRRRTIG